MDISNNLPPVTDSDVNDASDQDQQAGKDEKRDPSPFARLLARKHAVSDGGAGIQGSKLRSSDSGVVLGTAIVGASFSRALETSKTETAHAVPLPPELQQLVQEISVVSGGREVHIEMNSTALKALYIRIEKQQGAVAIQFQSSSADTARLLSRNAAVLSQSLADRGVNVAEIRVTPMQPTKPGWAGKNPANRSSNAPARGHSDRPSPRRS